MVPTDKFAIGNRNRFANAHVQLWFGNSHTASKCTNNMTYKLKFRTIKAAMTWLSYSRLWCQCSLSSQTFVPTFRNLSWILDFMEPHGSWLHALAVCLPVSHIRSVQALLSCLFKIEFNIMLPPTPRSLERILVLRSSLQYLNVRLFSFSTCCMPGPSSSA
jgi:hypothetical protein